MSTWIPISSALPDADTLVLVAFVDEDVWPAYLDGDTWRDTSAMPIKDDRITHWMHLPEAPGAHEQGSFEE